MSEENKELDDLDLEDAKEGEPQEIVVEKESEPVEPSIEDLQKQIEEQKARADAAERKAAEASEHGDKAKASAIEAAEARLQLAEENLKKDRDLAEREYGDAEREYGEAYDSGDRDKVIAANRKMFDAKIKLAKIDDYDVGLQKYRKEFEASKERALQEPENSDWLSDEQLKTYSPKAQEWIRDHDEFRSDPAFREKAVRAHYGALHSGIRPDTKEYFAFLEKDIGLTEEEEEPKVEVREEPKKAVKKPIPSGPPSRGNSTQAGSSKRVTLSAKEMDAAETCGMSPAEYYKYKYGANQ